MGLHDREFTGYQDAIGRIRECTGAEPPQPLAFQVKDVPGWLESAAEPAAAAAAAGGGMGADAARVSAAGGADRDVVDHSVAECKDNDEVVDNWGLGPWRCPTCTVLNEDYRSKCSICELQRPPQPPPAAAAPPKPPKQIEARAAPAAAATAAGVTATDPPSPPAIARPESESEDAQPVGAERASQSVPAPEAQEDDSASDVTEEGSDEDLYSEWQCPSCAQLNEYWRYQCSVCLTLLVGDSTPPPTGPTLEQANSPRRLDALVSTPASLDVGTDSSECDEEDFQGIDFDPPSAPPPADGTPVVNMEAALQNQLSRLSRYHLFDA